jgi:hypothetical protein
MNSFNRAPSTKSKVRVESVSDGSYEPCIHSEIPKYS